jgi:F0F1-type ATP synthase membrane subunit c/vacuolar-type H+-ATPase subunit K
VVEIPFAFKEENMRISSVLLFVVAALVLVVNPALAQEVCEKGPFLTAEGLTALGIAIAVVGGAMSQSKAISSALDNIGRNPGAAGQMFLPWLLALVLIESLVIYAFVISLKLAGFF